MDDLISRQAIIDAHYEYCNKHQEAKFYAWSLELMQNAQSAQPEIIRCKDCKHSFLHNNGERTNRICGRTRMCGTTPDDWYCADAEPRRGEEQ